MNLFRLLTILTLLPMTATSGMPHVGCRCSNGEIRWYCPKLKAQQSQKSVEATSCCKSSKNTARTSCCGGSQGANCICTSSRNAKSDAESCCTDGCKCTPVLITSDVGPKIAKVSVPDLQIHFANMADVTEVLVRVDRIDVSPVDAAADVPINRVVHFERFLI